MPTIPVYRPCAPCTPSCGGPTSAGHAGCSWGQQAPATPGAKSALDVNLVDMPAHLCKVREPHGPDQRSCRPMSAAPGATTTPAQSPQPTAGDPGAPATWHDPKRYAWLLGLLIPTLPFLTWGLVHATGVAALWFYGPLLVFAIFPLLYLPIQYAGLVFACWLWSSGALSTLDSVGLALTVAMVSGIAINTAHELGHKRASIERWLSKVALAQSGYGHFFIEHNRGHHVRVATPEDPASARLGETFYSFLPRTVIGSLRSAWELERVRLARLERSPWSLRNDILGAWAMSVVLFGTLVAIFGVVVLPYLMIQAVIGFSLLEVVNYLEHYGLLRGKREDGRYERTLPEHSWNSNSAASNVLLYHLQRHSDHPANPIRRYQALRHVDEAPQLPTGYAGMILLAVIPPVWRRTMDHRVLAH